MIYLPFSKGDNPDAGTLFEIHFVEDEVPFYVHGNVPLWRLTTKLFQYSGERINTGIAEIDNMQYKNAYTVEVTLDTGSGNYLIGETVHQPSSNLTAKVASWNAATKEIGLQDLTTDITVSKTLVGNTSGTTYTLSSLDHIELPEDSDAQNREFETEANTFVDFSETSPFGTW